MAIMEQNKHLSDIKWLSEFLAQSAEAESTSVLSTIVVDLLPQGLPFSLVAIFFQEHNSKFLLKSESEDFLRKAGLTEISVSSVAGISKCPCPLTKLLFHEDYAKESFYFETVKDLMCEPVRVRDNSVALLCYRPEVEVLSADKKDMLDLTLTQIGLSCERIAKEQQINKELLCQCDEKRKI